MKIFNHKSSMVLSVISILIASLMVFSFACTKKEEKVIKIGAVMPLTGEGAVYGDPQRKAAEIAVTEINEKGGLLGKKVVLFVQDDKAQPTEAVNIAHLFTSSKDIVGVIGHPNSGNAIPASKIYHEKNLPYVVTSATNPVVTQQGFKNVLRFAPTDDMQGISEADFIHKVLKIKSIVIIHDNAAYGKGLATQVKEHFESLGGKVLLFDTIIAGESDYRSLLSKVKQYKPSVIFYGGMHPEAAKLIKQAKEFGLETKFVLGDGCFDEELIKLSGTDGKNVYISFLAPPWEEVPSAKNFTEKYNKLYGSVPPFAPYGYDAIMVLAEGIKRASSPESNKIIAALRSPDFQLDGVTGKIKFNENGQVTDRSFYFYTFNYNGKLVLYK